MGKNQNLRRKVRNSYLISTVSISLVLFLLGSVGYMMMTAMDVAHSIQESITASVEIRSMSEGEREEIRRKMAAMPLVHDVQFSSREEKIADEDFRKMFGLEFEDILNENPLMDSFIVTLSAEANEREKLELMAREIEALKGVDRVSYPAVLVEQVHTTVKAFQYGLLFFGGALLFISLVLLNNTIRLAIFSKRSIINTMKLVGATRWFILRPFLWSGMWSGFWAGVIASALLGGVVYAIYDNMTGMLSVEQLIGSSYVMAYMVGGGMVISTLFTWITVNRYVSMKSNEIHLY
ncbi:MAG: permease-like cell division protein FtsX [Rikenellaceae bacterium]